MKPQNPFLVNIFRAIIQHSFSALKNIAWRLHHVLTQLCPGSLGSYDSQKGKSVKLTVKSD